MPKGKKVRFDNKPTKRAHSDDEDQDEEQKRKKPKIVKEEDEQKHDEGDEQPTTGNVVESNADAESKWENLVYYYLARLKGLCDWSTEPPEKVRPTTASSTKSCNSENLEQRVLKNVATENFPQPNKYWARNKKLNRPGQSEVSSYMVAGYQEGKEQGAKIVTRALKYGVLSGILAKQGSAYKIHPKYLKKPQSGDSTSNSEISIITSGSSSNSEASLEKNVANKRSAQGSKADKFQTEPDTKDLQMKRSFSHHEIDIFHKKPRKRHNYGTPVASRDLNFSRPSTSKNLQIAKHNARDLSKLSSKKLRVQEIPPKKLRKETATREGLRTRQRSSRGQTPYRSSRTLREHGSRAQIRDQKRKKHRPKSSSSNKSNQ